MPEQENAEPKKKKEPPIFGVYQLETGSYTLGESRFVPCKAIPCPAAVRDDLACEDTSPVKFFDKKEDAEKTAAALKAKFEAKRKPQPKED